MLKLNPPMSINIIRICFSFLSLLCFYGILEELLFLIIFMNLSYWSDAKN